MFDRGPNGSSIETFLHWLHAFVLFASVFSFLSGLYFSSEFLMEDSRRLDGIGMAAAFGDRRDPCSRKRVVERIEFYHATFIMFVCSRKDFLTFFCHDACSAMEKRRNGRALYAQLALAAPPSQELRGDYDGGAADLVRIVRRPGNQLIPHLAP